MKLLLSLQLILHFWLHDLLFEGLLSFNNLRFRCLYLITVLIIFAINLFIKIFLCNGPIWFNKSFILNFQCFLLLLKLDPIFWDLNKHWEFRLTNFIYGRLTLWEYCVGLNSLDDNLSLNGSCGLLWNLSSFINNLTINLLTSHNCFLFVERPSLDLFILGHSTFNRFFNWIGTYSYFHRCMLFHFLLCFK